MRWRYPRNKYSAYNSVSEDKFNLKITEVKISVPFSFERLIWFEKQTKLTLVFFENIVFIQVCSYREGSRFGTFCLDPDSVLFVWIQIKKSVYPQSCFYLGLGLKQFKEFTIRQCKEVISKNFRFIISILLNLKLI